VIFFKESGWKLKDSDSYTTVRDLRTKIGEFIKDREWEKYHNPKDLAESICIEAAELLEVFHWIPSEETLAWKNNPSKRSRVMEELADVLIYCLSMANAMEIQISDVITQKLARNSAKYPVDKYRGKAHLE
jgi:NTP pyrophosphatase (non-canonical NTP hydrolase)